MKEIVATVRFLTTPEGGRRTPFRSGNPLAVRFGLTTADGQLTHDDCVATLEGREWVFPGEECTVRLRPLFPDVLEGVVRPGLRIEIWEGRTIAKGEVTTVE